MIADWRRTFDAPLSFYIVQLANFMQVQTAPAEQGSWAELREAQSSTASSVPNTGVVVTTDVGDAKDIHPRNKQEVGRRLAAWALAKDYGQKVVHSGPTMKGFEIDGNRVRITFDHVGSGLLVKKGGPLRGFAIAGEDGKFVWGDARIEGDTVVVTARTVKKPVAVRYNWANNPIGNLANKESLPADSFRTDVPR
jgi:sialate O-acetylesterase